MCSSSRANNERPAKKTRTPRIRDEPENSLSDQLKRYSHSMARSVASSDSERRHVFSSFKKRVDSIKIEPNKSLQTRAHDYVDSSYFLAALQHWKEINISGDFTEFTSSIESYCQTLPQILHHQEAIFDALSVHIVRADVNSIQPLLELATQFVHDLGPDFMPYYLKFLKMIVNLAESTNPNDTQNLRNSSNILEWCFNCLAFTFKYLSKEIVADIKTTLNELIPTLLLTKKVYVSRFCAEALSYLIRKLDRNGIMDVIVLTFDSHHALIEENESYRASLVTLYSEAMKNTRNTFHSKSLPIISCLIENATKSDIASASFVSIVCDIVLEILSHGSKESCERFYDQTTAYLATVVQEDCELITLTYVTQVLVVMCFLDSGSKINSWAHIFDTIDKICMKVESVDTPEEDKVYAFMTNLIHLFVIVIRNCTLDVLTLQFNKLNSYALHLFDGKFYLAFVECLLAVSREKMTSFGAGQLVQSYASSCKLESELARLSLFLIRHIGEQWGIKIHAHLDILLSLSNDLRDSSDQNLSYILWKCVVLSHAPGFSISETQIVINLLQSSIETLPSCQLKNDIIGILLAVASSTNLVKVTETQVQTIFSSVVKALNQSRTSIKFLDALIVMLENHGETLKELISQFWSQLTGNLVHNLSSPSPRLREATSTLLLACHTSQGFATPDVIKQMMLIDQIPLTVSNSNDIKMRIRLFFSNMGETSKLTPLEKESAARFVIGLLNNQFQPSWTAVYEGLPRLLSIDCSEELWTVLREFLEMNFENQEAPYTPDDSISFDHDDLFVLESQSTDKRLFGSFQNIVNLTKVEDSEVLKAIVSHMEASSQAVAYKPLLRGRIVQALLSVPSLVERHGSQFISFAIRTASYSRQVVNTNNDSERWNSKEISELFSVFCKFKSLKTIPGNEDLYLTVLDSLTSRQTSIQKLSLSVLFAWNRKSINKYKDNLNNLLDDKLFREELQSLLIADSTCKIEDEDASEAIPIVLRILYGRAKGNSNKNSKSGKKFAVVNVLPNLPLEFTQQFLDLTCERIDYKPFFSSLSQRDDEILSKTSSQEMKHITGYLNMLQEIYNALGFKFANTLRSTVPPLIYSLVIAQSAIENSDTFDSTNDKISRNVRQLGFKCLNTLFKVMDGKHSWGDDLSLIFNYIVKPRLEKFSQENAQQTSSLMQIMLSWIEWDNCIPFLYQDDFAASRAIIGILRNPHVKEEVVDSVLNFCITSLSKKNVKSDDYFTVLAIIVDTLLDVLPSILESSNDRDINSKTASVLLLIIQGGYIDDNDTKRRLIAASTSALKKSPVQIGINDKVSILLSLASIIETFDCSASELDTVIDVCSKAFRIYKDRTVRESLVKVFHSLGKQIPDFEVIAGLLASLNSYSERRIAEPNFELRLEAFREVNENLYLKLSLRQWMPLLYCAFFFINDIEELALRTNAAYMLMRFVDSNSCRNVSHETSEFNLVFNSVFMPFLRQGLKKEEEQVREEYINVLAHIVRNADSFPEFKGLSVLANDDRELDFFSNITHIQLTSRQKAIRDLIEIRNKISPDCIYHYVLPITEVYTICKDERYRNILDDTHESWSYLIRCISWNHFRQLFRKHTASLSRTTDQLRDKVNLVTRLSQALIASYKGRKAGQDHDIMEDFPDQAEIDRFVMNDCIPGIMKILRVRNDETVIARTPLAEAAVNLLLCTSEEIIFAELPGTLTSTCQVLRSHTQHLRDAVRKTLGKISIILGARYFKFIIKELKTALSRGAQIHVLSYTVHLLLVATSESFQSGDLDESAHLITGIIMEDIFGASGQDKDAEDYVSKMREVKSKKSFDSGEILSSNISLQCFSALVDPVKLLLRENLPLKTQRKLDELLRRYALGLNHNPAASSRDILVLCYELHKQSLSSTEKRSQIKKQDGRDDHFLVQLNSKPARISTDSSQYLSTLQKMSFELLRTALGRHPELLSVSNIDGFVPLMELSLKSDDEKLLQAVFKVLDLVVKLPFPDQRDSFFESSAVKAFTILQDSPTTTSEISQISLKYLATVVRHKPSLNLSDSALTVVLTRIIPDLEEPDKQSLAFNFLKAIVSQHIMLPEVYEVMEKVANIMIVNHSKEIRDMSRSIYFQFLMEYEQGSKKLNSAFKFLVNNLNYPTQFGRQSVMELMHSLILRSSTAILTQLATSFFVGLSTVMVSDESAKCREMATSLISQIMKKMGSENLQVFDRFCQNWVVQRSNPLLQRCGLLVYKIYITLFGYDHNSSLDKEVIDLVIDIMERSQVTDSLEEVDWEDVYTALSVISNCAQRLNEEIFSSQFEKVWHLVVSTLLYPHAWVRLQGAKLVGLLLQHLSDTSFDVTPYEVQTIAYRSLRQLSAPNVSKELGNQIVKNISTIVKKWEAENTTYIHVEPEVESLDVSKQTYNGASDFAISRLCAIMRQESHRDSNDVPKTSAIQITAMIIQFVSDDRLMEIAEQLFSGLFNFTDPDNHVNYSDDIVNIAKECLKILEDRIGVTKYTAIHTLVKKQVDERRSERRAKRAHLAVSAPEIAARRKIRKHERFREKRKQERDENGFYKAKKKRTL